jgi:hypothetical protein
MRVVYPRPSVLNGARLELNKSNSIKTAVITSKVLPSDQQAAPDTAERLFNKWVHAGNTAAVLPGHLLGAHNQELSRAFAGA